MHGNSYRNEFWILNSLKCCYYLQYRGDFKENQPNGRGVVYNKSEVDPNTNKTYQKVEYIGEVNKGNEQGHGTVYGKNGKKAIEGDIPANSKFTCMNLMLTVDETKISSKSKFCQIYSDDGQLLHIGPLIHDPRLILRKVAPNKRRETHFALELYPRDPVQDY